MNSHFQPLSYRFRSEAVSSGKLPDLTLPDPADLEKLILSTTPTPSLHEDDSIDTIREMNKSKQLVKNPPPPRRKYKRKKATAKTQTEQTASNNSDKENSKEDQSDESAAEDEALATATAAGGTKFVWRNVTKNGLVKKCVLVEGIPQGKKNRNCDDLERNIPHLDL